MSSAERNPVETGSRPLRRAEGLARLAMIVPALAGSVASLGADSDGAATAWDRARAQLMAEAKTPIAEAVERWKVLTGPIPHGFADYAGFLTSYPGFPEQDKLRRAAEAALDREAQGNAAILTYFDRYPPLTNGGRAQYALALAAAGRAEAAEMARAAWRGGTMSDAAERTIDARWGTGFALADHDARIDALLWQGALPAANRVLGRTSPMVRAVAAGRIAAMTGGDPYAAAALPAATLDADPGFVIARARALHRLGRMEAEAAYLASRPPLSRPPFDRARWIAELLAAARGAADVGDSASVARIAMGAADAFAPGADVSQESYAIRDDYTSLMWLGGTRALWDLHQGNDAAVLFRRYAAAGRGPGVKAKGEYWAGIALERNGRAAEARSDFAAASAHVDQFYGLLAQEHMGQGIPQFPALPAPVPTAEERNRFATAPITAAVRELARSGDWTTTIRFFKEIAGAQETPGQFELAAELAQNLGRRDLGVIVGEAAETRGVEGFTHVAFPLIPVPPERSHGWTMIHAIIRQESQFAQNAVSHAGARGLMQMMPRTAGEQAGKLGLSYSSADLPNTLIADPQFNIAVGGAYFEHLLGVFGGSYPLAVAAYNAGAGNVGKWLRANGDPRTGQIAWIDWIERIPISETRSYVQHVLENAVVYEATNPAHASYGGPNPLSHFLGKQNPG